MHLSMLSPREGGGWANHWSLILRSVPWVGVLILCDVPRLAILIVQRIFYHFHLWLGGHFDHLFCPRGREFEIFSMKMSKSPPHASLGKHLEGENDANSWRPCSNLQALHFLSSNMYVVLPSFFLTPLLQPFIITLTMIIWLT